MFGRRAIFGKKKLSFDEVKDVLRPTPDDDGVTRVFSKELWADPKIGPMLREIGFAPDDARNIARTADDYLALFAASKQRLAERSEAYNRDMTARHGYCRAVPFLVIDHTIYDGIDGAFLYGQLGLIGYDDWNVMMLAADIRTKELCGLAGHPGMIPAHSEAMAGRVKAWRRRYDFALETFGITATGGDGITREQFEAERDVLVTEILELVTRAKPLIAKELMRIQA